MKILRDYQNKIKYDIYEKWREGHRNVLAVSPTGSGKTAIKADVFHECANRQSVIARPARSTACWARPSKDALGAAAAFGIDGLQIADTSGGC